MIAKKQQIALARRLMPLYVAVFFQGFVLWYAIEKLFMRQIGFNDAGIGVMVASYSALMLLVETPSGILADRWSRKGVLILASIALAASSLLGGLSGEPALYIISALFWGIFFALYSGTYDSIVYDTVVEETGKSSAFEKYLGRIKMVDSAALVAGSVAGGVVSQLANLPATYFLTVPLSLAAIVALGLFKEPRLHKAESLGSLKEQVARTFKAVLRRGVLLWLLGLIVTLSLMLAVLLEFSQLWLIALQAQPVLYGPVYALVLSAAGIGGLLASYAAKRRQIATVVLLTAMTLSCLALALVQNLAIVVAAQVLLGTSTIAITVLCLRDFHDALPSTVRAGAASAVSTFARVLLIPFGLAFGFLSNRFDVFSAAWLLLVLTAIVFICYMRKYRPLFWPSLLAKYTNKA